MSDTIWNNAAADNDGNNASNWSDGLPVAGKTAVFDATSTANCTFSGSITCDGFRIESGYAGGKVDLGDVGAEISLGSDGLVDDHAGELDLGTASLTITDGPFDVADAGTVSRGSSVVTMAGTCSVAVTGATNLATWGCADGAVISITEGSLYVRIAMPIGTATITLSSVARLYAAAICQVTGSGTITGAGYFGLHSLQNGAYGLADGFAGTISTALFYCFYLHAANRITAAGDYSQTTLKIYSSSTASTWQADAGSYTFAGFELEAAGTADNTIDAGSNAATIAVTGDVTFDIDSSGNAVLSGGVWSIAGDVVDEISGGGSAQLTDSPTLTFGGSADQSIDFGTGASLSSASFKIDKTGGTFTQGGDWAITRLHAVRGTWAPAGNDLTCSAELTIAYGFVVSGDLVGITWSAGSWIAHTTDLSGNSGTWYLTVSTAAALSGQGTVDYCDASGSSCVIKAPYATDGGNNSVDWDFDSTYTNVPWAGDDPSTANWTLGVDSGAASIEDTADGLKIVITEDNTACYIESIPSGTVDASKGHLRWKFRVNDGDLITAMATVFATNDAALAYCSARTYNNTTYNTQYDSEFFDGLWQWCNEALWCRQATGVDLAYFERARIRVYGNAGLEFTLGDCQLVTAENVMPEIWIRCDGGDISHKDLVERCNAIGYLIQVASNPRTISIGPDYITWDDIADFVARGNQLSTYAYDLLEYEIDAQEDILLAWAAFDQRGYAEAKRYFSRSGSSWTPALTSHFWELQQYYGFRNIEYGGMYYSSTFRGPPPYVGAERCQHGFAGRPYGAEQWTIYGGAEGETDWTADWQPTVDLQFANNALIQLVFHEWGTETPDRNLVLDGDGADQFIDWLIANAPVSVLTHDFATERPRGYVEAGQAAILEPEAGQSV